MSKNLSLDVVKQETLVLRLFYKVAGGLEL